MPNQLESALVIALRDNIKWESALVQPSGTLTPVDPSAPFNPLTYQTRDRELAYRDLIVSAAVVEVAIQVGDVWNYSTVKPGMEGPAPFTLPFAGSEAGTYSSQVRHVTNVSIPYDAARFADADLYGRDVLIYEVLARACASTFAEPSIPTLDSRGTLIPATSLWSLAQGTPVRADINAALPLNRELFKNPDRNLADRDNQLAGYTAQLVQVLKNPFEHALRLLVQINSYGTVEREPDVYALISDDGTHRVFQNEPALPGANKIVYNTSAKTIQWTRENVDEVHVPQIYAMVVPGIVTGQTVQTLAQVPDARDAQYWRTRAGQLVPEGIRVVDTGIGMDVTCNADVSGGCMQLDSASFTVPGRITFNLGGSLAPGNHRASILARPDSHVEIAGAQNISNTSGTLGGATFDINVPSGSITSKMYLVENGDGIVYNGHTYLPGETFNGTASATTYTQSGAVASTVRQYAITFQLALPTGSWNVQMEYTNLGAPSDNLTLKALYQASGADSSTVFQDLAPLPFDSTNGNTVLTPVAGMDVINTDLFTFPVYWTSGAGQLHIRKLTFDSATSLGRYAISGTLADSIANVDVIGENKVPGILRWQFYVADPLNGTLPLTLNYTADPLLPIKLEQVQLQALEEYNPTRLSRAFQGWRHECLERAERAIVQGYAEAVAAYGTDIPTFRDSGSNWSLEATEGWMSFVEVYNPRVREITGIDHQSILDGYQYEVATASATYNGTAYPRGAKFYGVESSGTLYSNGTVTQVGAFVKSQPGHVGRPALVPRGLYFDDTSKTVKAHYDTALSTPTIMACQPWMIELGLYVAQPELWLPELIGASLPSPFISLIAVPPEGGLVSGGGSFRSGQSVTATATPSSIVTVLDVGLDIAFVIDESGSMQDARSLLNALLPALDASLQSQNVGSATVSNKYSLIGFASNPGGTHGASADRAHLHCALGSFATFLTKISELTTDTGGTVGEDAYDGIDFAVNNLAWRMSSNVARLIVFITDEDRNVHLYTNGGPTQADQLSALADEVNALGAKIITIGSFVFPFDGNGNAIMGYNYARKTWRANGSGGFTNGTGGFASSPGGTGGLYPTGIRDEYELLAMDSRVKGQFWDYESFRIGVGVADTSGTNVLAYLTPANMGGFNGYGLTNGSPITINYVDYIVASVLDNTHLTLTTSAGTQALVDWSTPVAARTSFLAAFTDAVREDVLEELTWDFSGWYENGVLVSTDLNYVFTVVNNRTLEAHFDIS